MKAKFVRALFLLVLLLPLVSWGQAALNAPPGDPVYQAIDIFLSHGLISDAIIGQRPYSRLEIARLLREARKTFEEQKDQGRASSWKGFRRRLTRHHFLDRLLTHYERQYERELAGMRRGIDIEPFAALRTSFILDTSRARPIQHDDQIGTIDGIITSFGRYQQGGITEYGGNSLWSTQHNVYLTRFFAMTAEPFVNMNAREEITPRLQRLYLKTGWRNIEAEVGRDNLLWGQSDEGGLMLSSSARPLDMFKLSNPTPRRAPWIFKYLGPMKATFFVANLGPEQALPYPYFYGFKWSIMPSRNVEFGISETVITGGRGAPKLSFWDPLTELFPFHKWGKNNVTAADISNHVFGLFDLRITIPPLRRSIIYFDGYFEDAPTRAIRLPDNLLNQWAFIVGLFIPRLSDSGRFALRVEYHNVAPLTYRHARWQSGYTLNHRPLGDPLGPSATGIATVLSWRLSPISLARLSFDYDDFDSSTHTSEGNSDGGIDRVVTLVAGPHERRYRTIARVGWMGTGRLGVGASLGYERIQNWNFQSGRGVNNVLLEGTLSFSFQDLHVGNAQRLRGDP